MNTTLYTLDDMRQMVSRIGLDRIMDDTIDALSTTFADYEAQRYEVPVRDGFDYQEPQVGLIEWMPAHKVNESVTIKLVGYHPQNPLQLGLPTIASTVLCFDTRDGHLVAMMDGNLLTAIRTGAASAVASRILARPESRVLGLIGCGAQGVSQLHALSRVFDFKEVLVYDIDPAAQASFADRVAGLSLAGIEINPAPLDRVVASADILCTATSVALGAGPVFNERLVQPTVHINAVGSDFPGKTEIPHSLLQRSLVCPDFTSQAAREGECQQLQPEEFGPDILELVQRRDHYQTYQNSSTVFDSTGWAVEDHVTMKLLLNYCNELGCGTEVALADLTQDPHNPYAALQMPMARDRYAM